MRLGRHPALHGRGRAKVFGQQQAGERSPQSPFREADGALLFLEEGGVVEQVRQLIEQIAARGVAILLIEQKLDVATSLANRQLVMVGGEIALETTAAELERDTDMQRRFLGVEPVARA